MYAPTDVARWATDRGRSLAARIYYRGYAALTDDWAPLDAERAVAALPSDPHLVFLCLGNVCRSPFAARVARRELAARDLSGVTVASAGLSTSQGRRSPSAAVDAAAAFGVSLEEHRASEVSADLVAAADAVVLMDLDNYHRYRRRFPASTAPVVFLGAFDDADGWVIDDPYGGSRAEFERTYERVAASVSELVVGLENNR
jgi:protein-tyrosine phosphatase